MPGGEKVRALAEYDRRWEGVDPSFSRLHRRLRPLLTRRAMFLHLVLGLIGAGLYLANRWTGAMTALVLPLWAWLLLFLALTPLFMVLHEIAHGLACKAHGRRVRAVGITVLDYVLPSLYVDVTDMYMASRAGRIVVDLAGPLANLLLAALATLAALLVGDPWVGAVLVVIADVNLALALFTAWPFHGLQEDGYEALSELLRTTLLRRRAGALLQAAVGRAPAGIEIPRAAALVYLVGLVLTWVVLGGLLGLWLLHSFPALSPAA